MNDELAALRAGRGVWFRGSPGSGRTHTLERIARSWDGPVVWLRGHAVYDDHATMGQVDGAVLRCVDDAQGGLDRETLGPGPVLASGTRPGRGWTVHDVEGLPADEGVRLFLRHAPGARPLPQVRQLVRALGGHPTAVVAAARRWPLENLDTLLLEPSPGWPGLRDAWDALPDAERKTLALLCALGGTALREGVAQAGVEAGLAGLVATGWAAVREAGVYRVSAAVAKAVAPWQDADPTAYHDWFLDEARRRMTRWDRLGGARAWFGHGSWPTLHEGGLGTEPWFFEAWSLSDVEPEALLAGLDDAGLDPVIAARCRARAQTALGLRTAAIDTLQDLYDLPEGESRALGLVELGVAHHRLRELDAASLAYDDALAWLEPAGHARGTMLCRANQAALSHDKGDLDAASFGYDEAIRVAASLGERRLRGIFGGNLGALLVEQDALPRARAVLREAVHDLTAERDDRFLAIVDVNLAAVDLLEGLLDAADTRYAAALSLFGDTDPSSSALCHARRGAVAALRDNLDTARARHAQADALLSPAEDPHTAEVVALWRAVLEWMAGDRESALRRRRAAIEGERPLASISDDARLVLRLLEKLTRDATQVLTVGPEGAWFRVPGGESTDVSRYAAPSRILAALATLAETSPGEVADADALVDAGWPGERIVPDAARNRLSVALAQLRKLGLKGIIERTKEGWRLSPEWPTVLLRSGD